MNLMKGDSSLETGNDTFVFVLVVVAIVIWLMVGLRKWLDAPLKRTFPGMDQAKKLDDQLAELLAVHLYEAVCGKYRLQLAIKVDDRILKSRIYIDGVAKDEEGLYAIKLAKTRQQLEWTGSGLRDAFFPYMVLGGIQGVLYVDRTNDQVKKIIFDWDEKE